MYGDVNQSMDEIFSIKKVSTIHLNVSSKWIQ